MKEAKSGKRGHTPDFRITLVGLADPLEITNAHNEGHAISIALDYLERTGRRGFSPASVTLVEKMPTDLGRHEARVDEAEAQGRVLPPPARPRRPVRGAKAAGQGKPGVEPSGAVLPSTGRL